MGNYGMFATCRILTLGILLGTLSGCAALDVAAWLGGDAEDASAAPAQAQRSAAAPAAPSGWIADAVSRCATSNPLPTEGESIRWYGDCDNGKLTGHGTLIWYQGSREVERNEGGFRGGELHGEVVSTFDDGGYIVGEYIDGQRNGNFMIRRSDGSHLHANYEDGKLTARRIASAVEVDAWLMARAKQVASAAEAAGRGETVREELAQAATSPKMAQATGSSLQPAAKSAETKMAPTPAAANASDTAVPMPRAAAPTRMMVAHTPTTAPATNGSYGGTVVVSSDSVTNERSYAGRALSSRNARQQAFAAVYRPAAYNPSMASPLDSVSRTARTFANRDGPWVIDSRSGSAPMGTGGTIVISAATASNGGVYQGGTVRRAYSAPRQAVAAAYQPNVQPPRAASRFDKASQPVSTNDGGNRPWSNIPQAASGSQHGQPVVAVPAASPDTLFSQGYQLELAGQQQAAVRAYDELLLRHPSAPSALLANARLVQLRQQHRSSAPVVAGNPPALGVSPRSASLAPSQDSSSQALHRQVCSRDGLYESNTGWCGTVTSERGQYYWIRVDDVHLRGFATIGITRSACTGNSFLTWFSLGISVKVPKQCMTFKVG